MTTVSAWRQSISKLMVNDTWKSCAQHTIRNGAFTAQITLTNNYNTRAYNYVQKELAQGRTHPPVLSELHREWLRDSTSQQLA